MSQNKFVPNLNYREMGSEMGEVTRAMSVANLQIEKK
jgi:hypothetical protein